MPKTSRSSMFTRLLSLWVTGALLLPLSCELSSRGDGVSSPESDLSSDDDYVTQTSTYDYDYENSTMDYYTYNIELYEVLNETGNPKNKDSVQVFRHDLILSGLLVILVCQQT